MTSNARPTKISKTLSPNDVGDTGSHQAGMLIPKDTSVLAFFPRLDSSQKNPRCVLTLRDHYGERWSFTFVYYNNRFFGGTRNEYRLTGMTAFLKRRNIVAGDSIVLTRDSSGSYSLALTKVAASNELPRPGRIVLSSGWKIIDF